MKRACGKFFKRYHQDTKKMFPLDNAISECKTFLEIAVFKTIYINIYICFFRSFVNCMYLHELRLWGYMYVCDSLYIQLCTSSQLCIIAAYFMRSRIKTLVSVIRVSTKKHSRHNK